MGKRLYVGNLSYGITEQDLRTIFTEAGQVTEVKVVLDRDTGQPRGFAFVEMDSEGAATKAISSHNGREVQGRAMNVKEAAERTGGGGGGGSRGSFGGNRGGRG
jgi:RNA recognition motif-containing protein